MLVRGSWLSPVVQAQISSIIVDRFLDLDKVLRLVWLARWKGSELLGEGSSSEDFLFSLGFCQIDSIFGEAPSLLIIHLAGPIHPGFPESLLFRVCAVGRCLPLQGLLSPPLFLGRPAHISGYLQETKLQLIPDPFCPTTTSIAWVHLCDESILIL